MDENENGNAFASGIALTKEFLEPKLVSIGEVDGESVDVLVVAEGLNATSAETYRERFRNNPRRRKGEARLDRLESLIEHANRFKDDNSVLFVDANPLAPSIMVVLDYHEALNVENGGNVETGEIVYKPADNAKPRFGAHRGIYSFPVSDEWKAWLEHNEKQMPQAEFAEFLEDRILDVLPPPEDSDESAKALREIAQTLNGTFATAAKLVELSRGLAINIDVRVKNAQTLQSGEASIQYEETHNGEDNQPIKVPSLFVIGIPVFRFGAIYRIAVRLRYRHRAGSIMWFYSLYGMDRVLDHAIEEAALRAKDETKLPLLFGKPEE